MEVVVSLADGGVGNVSPTDGGLALKMLEAVAELEVHTRLGTLMSQQVASLIKRAGMDKEEAIMTRLMVGEMMKRACCSYFDKMEQVEGANHFMECRIDPNAPRRDGRIFLSGKKLMPEKDKMEGPK